MLDKNRKYMKGSNKRKSFVKPVGMNGFNFKNDTLFLYHYYQKWVRWHKRLYRK